MKTNCEMPKLAANRKEAKGEVQVKGANYALKDGAVVMNVHC